MKRTRLAARRKAVGLSQERLAEMLGVDRSTIVRWEAAASEPMPWHRPKLAQALKISIEELAVLLADVDKQPADAGWRDAASGGEDFGLLAIKGAVHGRSLDKRRLEVIEAQSVGADDVYAQVSARELVPEVKAQMARVTEYLKWPLPVSHRQKLCSAAGRLAGLHAWLMVDLNDYRAADAWYDVAIDAAREAEDDSLGGWLHGARSLVPTHHGDHRRAQALAERGQRICTPAQDSSVHAWLSALEARACAALGDASGYQRSMHHAAEVGGSSEPAQRRHGMDYSDGTLDLNYYEGTSLLYLQQASSAAGSLTASLQTLPDTRPKARAILTLGLAEAALQLRQLDEAAELISQALAISYDQPIMPVLQRASELHLQLHAGGYARVPELGEQLRQFARQLNYVRLKDSTW